MGKTGYTLLIIFCRFLLLPACAEECMYQECFCSGQTIMCSNRHMQALPQMVNSVMRKFTLLEIGSNNIRSIPAGRLPPNLTDMNFVENPIETIEDTAFDESANTLVSLLFSNTRLAGIPNAFSHLHALTYLYLTEANISDWNEAAMTNLGRTLHSLFLDSVGMTTWPDWLHNCSSLMYLTIAGSSISSIPDQALVSVASSLSRLSLYNNSLTMIPKALSNLKKLDTLYIQHNHIRDVSYLPQGGKLSSLTLSYNKVSDARQLSDSLRSIGNHLVHLAIDNNELTSIPDCPFLTEIGRLDLSFNKISDPTSGALPSNLYALDLNNNYIPSIPQVLVSLLNVADIDLPYNTIKIIQASDFHNHTTTVDLSNNLITELSDTSFPESSSIKHLNLNNNPISQISSVALQNLRNLIELKLQSSQLTRMPLGLGALTKLNTFDISNSKNLVCTCIESVLTDWILKRKSDQVLGECGHTSVYIFFSTLGPSCPPQQDFLEHQQGTI